MITITQLKSHALSVPSVRVTFTPPQGPPSEIAMTLAPITVGTNSECDIVAVNDTRVSRKHCELSLTERGIVLRDLGSKNGTFIGSVQILEAVLSDEAVVTLGNSRLAVRVVGPPSSMPLHPGSSFGEAIGQSLLMRILFARLALAAATPHSILLLGESGTGKELLARAIHDASPRRGGPFVVLKCGSLDAAALEGEMFGSGARDASSAGSPTPGLLSQANGGTLFIDELGELPRELQSKLLRALELGEVRSLDGAVVSPFDARLVAATPQALREQVAAKQFREDLYYRLSVLVELVPSLRERKEDIPLLAARFLSQLDPVRTVADLPPSSMDLLKGHSWPGNVRELRNTVVRLALFPHLGEAAIAPFSEVAFGPSGVAPLLQLSLKQARGIMVEQFQRWYLAEKLHQYRGVKTDAAAAIGVSRQFLHRLLKEYGMGGDDP